MRNYVVCGMQFGDEGKGSFVDYLSEKCNTDWIVRYNGGANASHTVITPSGRIHKFCQLGAGMFNEDTKVYMSSNMVINLDKLISEISKFNNTILQDDRDIYSRIYISPFCYVVTPYHVLVSKLRELSSGINRRGVGCSGVSEVKYLEYITRSEASGAFAEYGHLGIQIADLEYFSKELKQKIESLKKYTMSYYNGHKNCIMLNIPKFMKNSLEMEIKNLFSEDAAEKLACSLLKKYESFMNACRCFVKKTICGKLTDDGVEEFFPWEEEIRKNYGLKRYYDSVFKDFERKYTVIFEGAQGLLIDGRYGIRPNVTQLDTTTNFALKYIGEVEKNLKRDNIPIDNNMTKIGIAKPYYTKHGKGSFPTESYELKTYMCDETQIDSYWNGDVRYGWFDAVLFRYAQKINRVNQVFLSSIDKLDGLEKVFVCNNYEYIGPIDAQFVSMFDYYRDDSLSYIVTNIRNSSDKLGEYLSHCKPIYIATSGWKKSVIKNLSGSLALSGDCKNYVRLLSTLIGVPITMVSYGPSRDQRMFIHLR